MYAFPIFAVIDVNKTAVNECISITEKDDQFGKYGNKSRGLSVGTYVSYILLAFQELNNIDTSNIKRENSKSIFQICSAALHKYGYKGKNYTKAIQEGYKKSEIIRELNLLHNFMVILANEVKKVNSKGGLVVFVAWGKNGRPQ